MDSNGLLIRIDKLESDNRKMKLAGLFLIALLIAFVVASFARKDKLELKELTVTDASGAVIARLGGDQHGTCLELSVRSGASRAALCADSFYGSNLDLRNNNPEIKASLSAGRKLYEGGGDLVPGLFIEGDGEKFFVNVGKNAESFFGQTPSTNSLVFSGSPIPGMQIVDSNGKKVWAAPK